MVRYRILIGNMVHLSCGEEIKAIGGTRKFDTVKLMLCWLRDIMHPYKVYMYCRTFEDARDTLYKQQSIAVRYFTKRLRESQRIQQATIMSSNSYRKNED